MKRFFLWLQFDEGWKALLAVVYAVICLFDFVIVPSYIGITRPPFPASEALDLDVNVQLRLIEAWTYQHQPFTLKGNGLFHMAFGALLTGSAITKRI